MTVDVFVSGVAEPIRLESIKHHRPEHDGTQIRNPWYIFVGFDNEVTKIRESNILAIKVVEL